MKMSWNRTEHECTTSCSTRPIRCSHGPGDRSRSALDRLTPLVWNPLIALTVTAVVILLPSSTLAQGDPDDFRPFVAVDVIRVTETASSYVNGEVLDVNNDNMSVGWLEQTNGTTVAFLFIPSKAEYYSHQRQLTILDSGTYSDVVATGISERKDEDTRQWYITGYAIDGANTYPVYWNLPSSRQPQPIAVLVNESGNPLKGAAYDALVYDSLSDEEETENMPVIVGAGGSTMSLLSPFCYYIYNDEQNPFDIRVPYGVQTSGAALSIAKNPFAGHEEAPLISGWYYNSATSRSNAFAAYYDSGSWTKYGVHYEPNHYSSAYGMNDAADICGWYWNKDISHGSTFWEYVGSGTWTHTLVGPSPFGSPQNSAFDINNQQEIVLSNDEGDDVSGAWLWKDTSVQGKTDRNNLNDLTLFPPKLAGYESAERGMHRAYALNDHLWIAGSYRADLSDPDSPLRPVLLIPYDNNGNGIPDIREILDGTQPDDNNNWLIDWSEDFRVGLYAVGNPSTFAQKVENVQIVRVHYDQSDLDISDPGLSDPLTDILNVYGWDETAWNPTQREIIFMFRTKMTPDRAALWGVADYEKYDYIPPVSDPEEDELTQDEILRNARCFAYAVAKNADYIQFGNEIFGGVGVYYLHANDISGCGGWQGGLINSENMDIDCIDEACDVVFDWLEREAWAAREGSALAGRPIRIIGPSLTRKLLVAAASDAQGGQNGNTPSARFAYWTFSHTNRYADLCAIHLHYDTTDTLADSTSVVDWLTDPTGPNRWYVIEGVQPRAYGCTEWGPFANKGWKDDPVRKYGEKAKAYYQGPGPSGECPSTEPWPYEEWKDFVVNDWLGDPEGRNPGTDLGAPAILDALNPDPPADIPFYFGCFGNYVQVGTCPEMDSFDISSMWMHHLQEYHLDEGNPLGRLFSIPIRTIYEGEAIWHLVEGEPNDFIMHPEPVVGLFCDE